MTFLCMTFFTFLTIIMPFIKHANAIAVLIHCFLKERQILVEHAREYVMRCAIWYHLYHLKNVKNTQG